MKGKKFRLRRCFAGTLLLCGGLLSGCAAAHSDVALPMPQAAEVQAAPTPEQSKLPVEQAVEDFTLRELVGQLFWVRPDALDPQLTQETIDDASAPGVTACTESLVETLAEVPVGGIVFFGKNLVDAETLRTFQADLQAASTVPLLFAIDEEGGAVARLAHHDGFDVPQYESAAAVGTQGPEAVKEMAQTIGSYLRQNGFALDFAPVADVNTNSDNPIIGSRAFSAEPEQAAACVAAAVEGFHQAGMLCTLKHFPGHGDTAQDSHKGTAVTEKDWESLQACELMPFRAGIAQGADAVMAAHIMTPYATQDGLPASLSLTMLTERLRGELGFEGVIITDSLAMQAVTDWYLPGEAALLALQAGADVLLMPPDLRGTFDAVLQAAEEGELSRERLEQSVVRILTLKENAGLWSPKEK